MITKDLMPGQVVLTTDPWGGSWQRSRADDPSDDRNDWLTVDHTEPAPRSHWEYHNPRASSRWDVRFTDGTWAISTRDAEWVTR